MLKFLHGQVEDAKALCNRLAGGELSSSPFDEVALDSLRDDWCKLLGGSDWKHYRDIPPGQPFLLRALAKSAEILEDPDWKIISEGQDSYCTGVPLGYDDTIPHLPQVYEPKVKHRRFDDDLPEWDRANYASAQLSSQQLLEKFRSEVDLGRMQATTLGGRQGEVS